MFICLRVLNDWVLRIYELFWISLNFARITQNTRQLNRSADTLTAETECTPASGRSWACWHSFSCSQKNDKKSQTVRRKLCQPSFCVPPYFHRSSRLASVLIAAVLPAIQYNNVPIVEHGPCSTLYCKTITSLLLLHMFFGFPHTVLPAFSPRRAPPPAFALACTSAFACVPPHSTFNQEINFLPFQVYVWHNSHT